MTFDLLSRKAILSKSNFEFKLVKQNYFYITQKLGKLLFQKEFKGEL